MYCLPKELFHPGLLHRMRKKVFVKYLSHQDKFRIFERFKQGKEKNYCKKFWRDKILASSDIWAKKT